MTASFKKCTGLLLISVGLAWAATAADFYAKEETWTATLHRARERLAQSGLAGEKLAEAATPIWYRFKEDFPVQWDWTLQDAGEDFPPRFLTGPEQLLETVLIPKVVSELEGPAREALSKHWQALKDSQAPAGDRRWLDLYAEACQQRREQRLRSVLARTPRIVFTRKRTIRPSFFAYTEGQSDAQHERHFLPGAELCLLEFGGAGRERLYGITRVLLADPDGAIRDPAVSWDGTRVLFAWKRSLNDDDYHLYELTVRGETNVLRQITSGRGFADYEPAWLPNGHIVFASTRCVQTVDCWWTEVSNLYTCDPNGQFLRRLSFDQVHAIYPQVMDDGRVTYTRWDYNDRGQIFPQGLFQMREDGTGQSELYGNNSWFPTTIAHARGIPGTAKVLAILCGHHSSQAGKLAVVDPARGRQENRGVQLIAPPRETPAERIDSYGQEGELWQYPYPLSEEEFLTGYAPLGWDRPAHRGGDADFGIYWMNQVGHRELLAWDRKLPSSQPVPLAARARPQPAATTVDYRQDRGTYYVGDVYAGDGLAGVPRGTIKKLRVVALEYRAAGVGNNGSAGPGGAALVCTPVAVGNGTWDVKVVLGEAEVHNDGSALFSVPARVPVYFQALDERGFAVQTMRSWSTLQPGEFQGCVGCHENKNTAPAGRPYQNSLAFKAGSQPIGSSPQPFSFPRYVQPILDRHCVKCHHDREPIQALARGALRKPVLALPHPAASEPPRQNDRAFSLLGTETADALAKRNWSDAYLVLTQSRLDAAEESRGSFLGDWRGPLVNWIGSQSVPEMLPPYSGGAARSDLLAMIQRGHKGVQLSNSEIRTLACWIDLLVPYCGDYLEANTWTDEEMAKYRHFAAKRALMEKTERGNILELIKAARN